MERSHDPPYSSNEQDKQSMIDKQSNKQTQDWYGMMG